MASFEIFYKATCNQARKGDSNQVFTEVEHPGTGHQILRAGALLAVRAKQVQDEVAGFHNITVVWVKLLIL